MPEAKFDDNAIGVCTTKAEGDLSSERDDEKKVGFGLDDGFEEGKEKD